MRLRAYVALPVSGWRRRRARRRFRYLLERHGPGQVLFETVREYLSDQGLMLKQGRILDARIIAAPASRKNRRGERDPETKQSRKGKQWHLGMKLPIVVDDQTGLVHSLATPFAKVHDRTPADQLLHGEEVRVWGDAGDRGIEKREDHEDRKVAWHSDEVGTTQKMSWRPIGTSDETVEVECEGKDGTHVVLCQADV